MFHLRTPSRDYGTLRLALAGVHQVTNAVVAVRVLEALEAAGVPVTAAHVERALATVRWPGRLERVTLPDGREALLDAAHNADGAGALASYLSSLGPARPLVLAAMRDKDAGAMLRALAPCASALVLTRASNPRSTDPADLAAIAREVSPDTPCEVAGDVREALACAWRLAPRIAVAGSIFLLADVMKELGRS